MLDNVSNLHGWLEGSVAYIIGQILSIICQCLLTELSRAVESHVSIKTRHAELAGCSPLSTSSSAVEAPPVQAFNNENVSHADFWSSHLVPLHYVVHFT